jgi:type I restriction enzyme S subunit
MELKPGYKQTEVGVIPAAWDVAPLGTLIGPLDAGVSVNSVAKEKDPFAHDKSVLKTSCVLGGRFFPEEHKNIIPQDVHRAKLNPRKGSVIISRANTLELVGECGYVERDYPTLFLSDKLWMTRSEGSETRCDRWLVYLLGSRIFRRSIRDIATGTSGSMKNISKDSLRSLQIPLPPLAEQEAVAEALSDADAVIESLEQLIAKKRYLKQGAMQELLSGKNRLPGFSGEWKTRPVGEVISHCSSGATPHRGHAEYYKGDIKWVTSGELNYNLITDTVEKISKVAAERTNLKLHPVGTFLMAITGLEAAGTRGACGIVGSPATTNQSCMAIYPTHELSTQYLYHCYVYRGNNLALEYCQGTKQQSYTAKLVRILPIDLPPTIEEQTAIAAVLTDIDAEISALSSKLGKTRQIKEGMMHNLLTGRIRLV